MIDSPPQFPNRLRRRLLVGSGLTYGTFASANALPAVALVQIAAAFELSDSESGLIFAIGAGVNFFTLPLFGLLAERFGKRGLLTAGLALLAVGLGVFCSADTYLFLLVGSATLALGSAIVEALVSPLVTDLCPQQTAPVMNRVHSCYQIGLVITAIAAGLYLANLGDWTGIFWPAIAVSLALAILFATVRFPSPLIPEAPHGVLGVLRQGPFWICAVSIAAAGGVEVGVTNWVSSFLQREFDLSANGGWLVENLGLTDPAPLLGGIGIALFAAPMVVGRWFYGSLAERFGYVRTLVVSNVISIIALVGLGFASTVTAATIWLSILGLAISGMWPTVLTFASSTIRASLPTLFAMLAMAGLLGVGGCSWGVGLLADHFGLQAGLTSLAIPMVVGLAALFAFRFTK